MNWNTTENCFQTIYHPSIPHGALVGARQRKRISMDNSNDVIQYPLVHHPLEALYGSVVDELQLSFTLVTYALPSVGRLLKNGNVPCSYQGDYQAS